MPDKRQSSPLADILFPGGVSFLPAPEGKEAISYLLFVLALIGLYLTSLYNYLLFHALAELFSIVIAFAVFMITWHARRFMHNPYLHIIGIAYFFIAIVDLLHTLSYKGMAIFPDYDYATRLWIGARYLESLTLLVSFFFLEKKIPVRTGRLFAVYFLVTGLLLASIFRWKIFPVCFVPGEGLTPFKIISEYIISAILLLAIVLLIRKREFFAAGIFRLLLLSLVFTIFAELAFTFYVSRYGLSNLVGHYFKIFSYFCVYQAVVKTGIESPYNLIFRELKKTNNQYREEIVVRKRSEREREKAYIIQKQEKEKAQLYLDIAPALILALDPAGRIRLMNRKGRSILECEEQEVTGRDWFDTFIPGEEREQTRIMFRQIINSDIKTYGYDESRIVTLKGGVRLIRWHTIPLHDGEGRITGTLSSGEDITETRAMEEELRHTHKMEAVGTLAGGIAHDFNNMLSIILGNTELALEESPPGTETRICLEEVRAASLRAKEVVGKLLSFSSMTLASHQTVELQSHFADVLQLLRSSIPATIHIRTIIPEDLDPVWADPDQLNQLLIHLATNGAQAMEEGGGILEIRAANVSLDRAEDLPAPGLALGRYIRLQVSDTGRGIESDLLDKIFDPYFTTREFGKGSGMGLAVVHGIVKELGGTVTVDSTPGKGSTFTVYLSSAGGDGRTRT